MIPNRDGSISNLIITGINSRVGIIIKYDPNGKALEYTKFGTTDLVVYLGNSIVFDSKGNLYVSGTMQADSPGIRE